MPVIPLKRLVLPRITFGMFIRACGTFARSYKSNRCSIIVSVLQNVKHRDLQRTVDVKIQLSKTTVAFLMANTVYETKKKKPMSEPGGGILEAKNSKRVVTLDRSDKEHLNNSN